MGVVMKIDFTLLLLVVAFVIAGFFVYAADQDRANNRINRGTYTKLFLAGSIGGAFGLFWLIPNTYYVKAGFALFGAIFGGILVMIRVTNTWRYTERRAKTAKRSQKT
jgi:uncharacterized membrane protein YsdA (DUF1294 family)